MPAKAHAPMPVPALGEATVPLASFIRPVHRHYFTRQPERPNYRMRRYDFAGTPAVMPLVRAFLDTCAAERDTDYRYLFTLLGSELANNAIRHSLSGRPGGSYTLLVHRHRTGLRLACRDRGGLREQDSRLTPKENGLNLDAESGRGLAMVDAFATEWGDNGNAHYRTVWFYLAYDLTGSRWNTHTDL
ncbi:ATP-binding protein [Nocardiopsis alborubida]|uniref:ATP-binding protein n=1 Tax=Nocardiopsis alborubida TaxID=146802 RepID=A0A7X6MIJ3_9ACTN|nr:ATP-binding protein [Nocardiopsis alborubida]NKZ01670.1 ATP-binding protein [Nocardiopsis alborubida]